MAVKTNSPSEASAGNGAPERPRLSTLQQLAAAYPGIKLRTLKYWVGRAPVRQVSRDGRRGALPGNGLERAIIRKGRITLIDEARFLEWLYGREGES